MRKRVIQTHRKLYPLADKPKPIEAQLLGFPDVPLMLPNHIQAVRTGEFRCPRKGEWYLSGAIAEGWRAPANLTMKFHILKLVRVELRVDIVEVTE